MKGRKFITLASRIAAILAVPLLISTIYLYIKFQSSYSGYYTQSLQEGIFNTVQAPLGAKTQVALPDGSLVWLNSGSSLSYPAMFDAKSRNVELNGEAYFEIVKNEKVPMLVSTANLQVKVYGTKFNLNAYNGEDLIETALVEGKVSLIAGKGKKEYFLKPGYAASYSLQKGKLQVYKVQDMDAFTGWKDGKLLFRDKLFADILKELERWYNVDIHLADKSLGEYALHATFFDENIEQVLDIISNSLPIQVEYPKRVKQPDGTYLKREIIIKRDLTRKMIIR